MLRLLRPLRTTTKVFVAHVLPTMARTRRGLAPGAAADIAGSPQSRLSGSKTPTTSSEADAPPNLQLRRSSRRISSSKNMRASSQAAGTKRPAQDGDTPPTNMADMSEGDDSEAEGQLNLAIKNLKKMERRLQRATKRQRLKIENSFTTERDDARERAGGGGEGTSHQATSAAKPRANQTGQLLTPEENAGDEFVPDVVDEEDDDDSARERGEVVGDEDAAAEGPAERGANRPPAVNSSHLPLPWTGRLGYACLNTYLRSAKPPVFSSRTCRIASILDHRHPLQDPAQPEHATKNRPDKSSEPDVGLGMKFVQDLGLANARDIVKMVRWNDKYNIKFMRLSSEMFPFASHPEYGYRLAPFAADVLAEAGRVATELGHRLTTHPGQFTQLGSPRKEVIASSVRDLEYHDELLTLLRLPAQQDRDAVMILHMGGVFGDKTATLARFRQNYTTLLTPSIKARLVLENDDVSWSVHDLLPICEELNIPLVLDWHHHNIVFDASSVREGTLDISEPALMERISATWRQKGIVQKFHYSEACSGAVTPRDRRKHRARVATLPPCPAGADLMIEAKDKEQAVFELMRTFRLPGFERVNDMIPHERADENKPAPRKAKGKAVKKGKKGEKAAVGPEEKAGGAAAGRKRRRGQGKEEEEEEDLGLASVPEAGQGGEGPEEHVDDEEEKAGGVEVSPEEFGMGGPMNRVYWPPGMEEWLRPKKRETKAPGKKKEADDGH